MCGEGDVALASGGYGALASAAVLLSSCKLVRSTYSHVNVKVVLEFAAMAQASVWSFRVWAF